MYIENEIVLKGDWAEIWRNARDIERWPVILPHYIQIDILDTFEDGRKRKAYMKCWWHKIMPVSWTTVQTLEPNEDAAQARVRYNHIGGVTKGMEVIWSFEPLGDNSYKTRISHDWIPNWPIVGGPAAYFIQTQVVHYIADRTLSTMKKLAAEHFSNKTLSKAAL